MALIRLLIVGAEPLLTIIPGLAVLILPPAVAARVALVAFSLAVAGWFALVGRFSLQHPKAWAFPALPILLQAGVSFAYLLMETRVSIVGTALLAAAATARYGWYVLVYFHFPSRYRPFSLAVTAQAVAIITVFFVGFDLLALTIYLDLPALFAVFGALVISGVVAAAGLISYRIAVRRAFGMILAMAALLAELYALALMLPMLPVVSGGMFALAYYVLSGLARLVAEGNLARALVIRYAAVSVAGVAVILGTARWI